LKGLETDQAGVCAGAGVNRLETRPKPLYTMASLLTDLTRVAQYIKDEKLKKALIDKDRDKAGEHGGIGTPATRDAIIKTLFDRGFITAVKKGKASSIVSTQVGRDLYDALPDEAKFPDLTAIWHGQQQDIEAGKLGVKEFIANLVDYMAGETEKVRANGLDIKTDLPPCPACGGGMTRKKGKNGFFWGCSGYPECKATLPDDNGKPGEAKARASEIQTGEKPSCPVCGKPMRLLQGQKGEFWGCSGYPECKKTLSRKAGDSGEPMEKPIVSEIHKCPVCGKGLSRRRDQKSPDRYWWGCSGYPNCRKSFPDQDGKPNYQAQKRTSEKTA
jgi:DNA topoisomerase-3